ncbi:unnamed protein product [Ixodes hexagonus]
MSERCCGKWTRQQAQASPDSPALTQPFSGTRAQEGMLCLVLSTTLILDLRGVPPQVQTHLYTSQRSTMPSVTIRSYTSFLRQLRPRVSLTYQASTLFYETLAAPLRVPALPPAQAPDPPPCHQSHADVDGLPESCPLCNAFYTDFVVLSRTAAAALEFRTRGTTNALWRQSRKLRVTASNVIIIPKKPETPHEKSVASLTGSGFRGNAATRRGHQYEPVARAQFQRETGLTVALCGTVVCEELPWLSATPDGIIESHNAILEIKCPNTDNCRILIATGTYEVKCKDGIYFLDPEHDKGYYSQVQYTMLCTKKQLCIFYVWSLNGVAQFTVPFNERYIKENMPRLMKFYFCSMLPHLEEKHRNGSHIIGMDYRRLTEM